MSAPKTHNRRGAHAAAALVAAALLALLVAAPAGAAPQLQVQAQHTPATMPRNDEFLTYKATVKNVGSEEAVAGSQLKCVGPLPQKNWVPQSAGDKPTYSIEWRRNAVPIPGAGGAWSEAAPAAQFYTATSEDEGKAIQCLITGTNSTAAGVYASLPATVVAPAAAMAPPLPSLRTADQSRPWVTDATGGFESAEGKPIATKRFCKAPANWSISAAGTATLAAGSNTLTSVVTAKGTGTLTSGSKTISAFSPSSGSFLVGQSITGAGIPAGATIVKVSSKINASSTIELSLAATASGAGQALAAGAQPFLAGQEIAGAGIPAGTRITAVSGQTLTLSANASASAAGVAISTPGSYTYQWLRNAVPIAGAEAESAEYQPVAADEGKNLQCEVVGTGGGGSIVGLSDYSRVSPLSTLVPWNSPPNTLEAVVQPPGEGTTLEVELPAGEETRVFKVTASGWSCASQEAAGEQRAKVTCSRSDLLNPQASYPPVEVATSIGADAADPAVADISVSGGGSAPDSVSDELHWLDATPFRIDSFTTKVADPLGVDYTQAGGHPTSAAAALSLSTRVLRNGATGAVEHLRNAQTDVPAGFLGNVQAVPQRCNTAEEVLADTFTAPTCPRASIVGGVDLVTAASSYLHLPIYVLRPERGVAAQLEFAIHGLGAMYSLTPRLRPGEGYAISLDSPQAPKSPVLLSATATLCGFGANVVSQGANEVGFSSCRKAGEAGANPIPLLTNPTECSATPPVTKLSVDSWEHPGTYTSKEAIAPKVTGCDKVPFSPTIAFQPTSHEADSPTGLDVSITMPTDGLETANGISQAALKDSTVTLPEGMSVNPAAANGLGACEPAQIGLGTNDPVSCPDSAKIGTAKVKTPLLEGTLEGNVYIAKQGSNPFGSLLALYLVVESRERGIIVKLPGKVVPSASGRLTASFSDNPQVPFSSLELHFNSGDRAALLNPPACGTYGIQTTLTPWSAADPGNPTAAESRTSTSSFQVTSGPGGRPCPADPPVLDPHMNAGLTNPVAGARGAFVLDLSREDATQRFAALDVTMPPGLSGYLKGIPYCPDATLAAIPGSEGSGAAELAAPSCPAASLLGSVSVGAGAGSLPFYANTGRAYLAGPYKGAPLSIAIVTPALAGPFDLGSVMVRSAAYVDPTSAQITVRSDPLPTVLHGIALDVRDIRVNIDRPDFILAPTNCEAMSLRATVTGERGSRVSLDERFQVGECGSLGFAPRLSTHLFGGTRRNDNPRFRSVLSYGAGAQANVKRVVVALPHSVFLDNEHIRTICTRVQFAARACPKGSIYGYAKAFSPLLDYAVQGPVYLRSSDNPLPDLVVALKGPASQPIEVDLVGRIDSFHGGIRTTFNAAPDAPVSKFVLEMKGGDKGLLVNSRDICASTSRVSVKMEGQNGMSRDFRALLANDCGRHSGQQKRHRGRS